MTLTNWIDLPVDAMAQTTVLSDMKSSSNVNISGVLLPWNVQCLVTSRGLAADIKADLEFSLLSDLISQLWTLTAVDQALTGQTLSVIK